MELIGVRSYLRRMDIALFPSFPSTGFTKTAVMDPSDF
jgi:hypothetical protein